MLESAKTIESAILRNYLEARLNHEDNSINFKISSWIDNRDVNARPDAFVITKDHNLYVNAQYLMAHASSYKFFATVLNNLKQLDQNNITDIYNCAKKQIDQERAYIEANTFYC